jgi:hypothetical protein
MTVQLTDDLTNQYAQSIPVGNVYMDSSVNYVMSGTCTTGLNTINTWTAINSGQTVLEKASATGQVCTVAADTVNLAVVIPAAQPVGMYTGTLTITLPF